MEPSIEKARKFCESGALQWTNHVFVRLMQRNISTNDVEYAIMNGEIIEVYPEDYPYPSSLVLCMEIGGAPLHVVCGFAPDRLWIITAYRPDLTEWETDYRTRKEN